MPVQACPKSPLCSSAPVPGLSCAHPFLFHLFTSPHAFMLLLGLDQFLLLTPLKSDLFGHLHLLCSPLSPCPHACSSEIKQTPYQAICHPLTLVCLCTMSVSDPQSRHFVLWLCTLAARAPSAAVTQSFAFPSRHGLLCASRSS